MNREYLNPIVRLILFLSIASLMSDNLVLGDTQNHDTLQFDVPAISSATVLHQADEHQKIVEVRIPVSLATYGPQQTVQEIRIEVHWNRNAFPIVDYGPKTTMYSNIEGNVSIEKREDSNHSLGFKLTGGISTIGTGSANAQTGSKNLNSKRYTEIPQHNLLISSGTLKRGTGVSYRFHPSRTTTLEGGRDLVVAFAVPANWRAGVLTVRCHAKSTRQSFGAFTEDLDYGVAFVMPVYLKGDDQARQFANEFVQSEQKLRSVWKRHLAARPSSNSLTQQLTLLMGNRNTQTTAPEHWVNGLIQSGSDDWLKKYRRHVPSLIASRASQFVDARNDLSGLAHRK